VQTQASISFKMQPPRGHASTAATPNLKRD
jgi:hypothetical protein